MNWHITNICMNNAGCTANKDWHFTHTSDEKLYNFKINDKNVEILIDGYVVPRIEVFSEYKNLAQYELLEKLFCRFGLNFIDYIKGVFNIVIMTGDQFHIFNDHHSIKKFFIYQKDKDFFISNNLKTISDNIALSIDKENIALFCLMEHFIDGMTIFNNVKYSNPATKILFKKTLIAGNYWQFDNLLKLKQANLGLKNIAEKWRGIIDNYISFLKPKDITMTLTGGNDSRMILAALLNLTIKINTFTFGNPQSNDGVVAKKIAKKLNLNYNNHYVNSPTSEWFEHQAEQIMHFGDSLINIHRAHRRSAIKDELTKNPGIEMIFGGFMGGDYIKGIIYDDYITAKLVRLWEYNNNDKKQTIKKLLADNYFNVDQIEINKIITIFENQFFVSKKKKIEREFSYVANVVGSVHDAQDTNVFDSHVKYVVNPYMDIDFLELLFSSEYSMMNKNNSSKNQLKRFLQPKFHCEIMNRLAPELSDIRFAKKGYYSVNEFLGNKLIYLLKRACRYKFKKDVFPPNFPYELWIKEFCDKTVKNSNSKIAELFNLKEYKKSLGQNGHEGGEGYWHQFTNMINIQYIFNYYGVGNAK